MADENDKKIRGQQIKELFDLCLDLPPRQQNQIIKESTFSEDIKAHVEKLLNFSDKDSDMTQTIVDSVQVSLDIKPLQSGMKIGCYILQQQIGYGGQGEVWSAFREGGDFHHKVAVKFLKPVHDNKELIRFQNERELLASLNHPNIAQLLDGGEYVNNRPYMVLELVNGLPIIEYIRNNKLSIKQQLICFLQICDAIGYAHSHSVIHRDIKPSNIYVTNEGIVKLLDFGIAKFLDKEEQDTQTLPMMTLAYSSPEQVSGAPISTATDIYTLGLLLYEMLTGQRAQNIESEAPSELIHVITEQTPTLPSIVLNSINFVRGYSNSQLKGDLDNLILMAVRKEPQRRYATVNAMAKDIKNYLDNKPLIATGDSWIYKTKKLISRNPTATVLALLLIGIMIALPLTLISNQNEIKQQRDKAIKAEIVAKQQNIIANRTTDFLVNILESASPLASKGEEINLNDVLLNAEKQLAVGLENQPIIKANLLSKLAGINHHLNKNDKAIEFYLKAYEIYDQQNDDQQKLFILGQLAISYHFNGEYNKRDSYKQKAINLSQKITDPFELGWHQARMATLAFFIDDFDFINTHTPKTLTRLKQNNIDDPELLGRLYNELALAQNDHQKEKALAYINSAMTYAEIQHGKMYPKYQSRRLTKASILMTLHRYTEAEEILKQSITDAKKLYSKDHPAYSHLLEKLGSYYHDKGRFTDTERVYKEAIEIIMKNSNKESTDYLVQINNLAYLYEDSGQYQQAEELYRESLKLRIKIYGEESQRAATAKANLARLLAKVSKYNESDTLLTQALPIFTKNNKSNLYNRITQTAQLLSNGINQSTCIKVDAQINEILPKLNKVSEKSWRRMHAELWLGEIAYLCGYDELTSRLLNAANNKSKTIYAEDSDGQKIIQTKLNKHLQNINIL